MVTALHCAAATNASEVLLATLLRAGALINALDDCHRIPLYYAAEAGHAGTFDWLIDHGADVTSGREDGSTPVCHHPKFCLLSVFWVGFHFTVDGLKY